MGMGNIFKQRYDQLVFDVETELKHRVNKSDVKSEFLSNDQSVINVDIFDYVELAIVNDKLTFLDNSGYQYDVFSECNLTDLIDILNT